jgi:hypothetical protein
MPATLIAGGLASTPSPGGATVQGWGWKKREKRRLRFVTEVAGCRIVVVDDFVSVSTP